MRIGLNILGVLGLITGGVWMLQGMNVLAGSFMSGQHRWLVLGAICALASLAVLALANSSRR
jgi:hypothetical protein